MRSSIAAVLLGYLTVALAATTTYSECSTVTKSTSIPTPTGTSGCGKDQSSLAGKTSIMYTIQNDSLERQFLVHVPSNYQKGKDTGVILSFHGNNKNMCYQEQLSQFSKEEYNPNWIAVYPQGLGESWFGPTYHHHKNSDFNFVTNILKTLRSEFCIDNTRIYASGKSNGGGFVGTLACDPVVGINFAAFAPVSGAFYTDVNSTSYCQPSRPLLPIAEFHGADDDVIEYDSPGYVGSGGPLPTIPDWLDRWAVRNGCTKPFSEQEKTAIKPDVYKEVVTKTKYTCNGKEDIVAGYKIDNWCHWWPTTNPAGNLDTRNKKNKATTIEATKAIMTYFNKWTNPGATRLCVQDNLHGGHSASRT